MTTPNTLEEIGIASEIIKAGAVVWRAKDVEPFKYHNFSAAAKLTKDMQLGLAKHDAHPGDELTVYIRGNITLGTAPTATFYESK